MSTLVFDTFENVKKLKAVGFSEAQAEVQTRIITDLVESQLVTRQYLDERFKEVDTRFKEVDTRFKEMELRLTIRLGAMIVVAISIVATLVKLL